MVRFSVSTQRKIIFSVNVVFLLFTIFFSWSCNDHMEVTDIQVFSDLEIGQTSIFKVTQETEIIGKRTLEEYFLKEAVTDSFRFNNEKYFRKEVFSSSKIDGPWQFKENVFEYRNLKGIFIENGSLHFLKIALPAEFSTTWKVNQRLESLNGNQGKYLDFKAPYILNLQNYRDGLKVQILKDSTGVHNFEELEVYSPNFGLVYSTKRAIYYCQSTTDCLGKGVVESFLSIKKELVIPFISK